MRIFKSLGDGVGTAAGVAWPLFGILSSVLSLTIGSLTALILGSISGGLFLLVLIPIAYWSHKNHLRERKILKEKLVLSQRLVAENLLTHFLAVLKLYLHKHQITNRAAIDVAAARTYIMRHLKKTAAQTYFSELEQEFDHTLLENFSNNNEILDQLLNYIKSTNDSQPASNERLSSSSSLRKKLFKPEAASLPPRENLLGIIKPFTTNHITQLSLPPPPKSIIITSAISGFCAAFGTVAGCSAGTFGLLVGIGVFTGLAAVPIAGWIALAAAITFGIIVAATCAYHARKNAREEQLLEHCQHLNSALDKRTLVQCTTLDMKIKYQHKYKHKHTHKHLKRSQLACLQEEHSIGAVKDEAGDSYKRLTKV